MRRRQYIAATGTVAAGALAGCIGGDDTGTGDEESDNGENDSSENDSKNGTNESDGDSNETETASGQPAWVSWVPAEAVVEDTEITVLDIPQARADFPEAVLDGFGLSDLAGALGVDESNMDLFLTWERRSSGEGPTVLTGNYDPDAVAESLQTESGAETYRGFRVLERQFNDDAAVSDSAVILGGDVRRIIDAHEGATPSFGQSEDWRTLLEAVGHEALVQVSPGVLDPEDPTFASAQKTAFGIDAADGGARLTGHYLFASPDRALDAFQGVGDDDDEDSDDGDDEFTMTLLRAEVDGRRVIYVVETEGFEFLLSDDSSTPLSGRAISGALHQ